MSQALSVKLCARAPESGSIRCHRRSSRVAASPDGARNSSVRLVQAAQIGLCFLVEELSGRPVALPPNGRRGEGSRGRFPLGATPGSRALCSSSALPRRSPGPDRRGGSTSSLSSRKRTKTQPRIQATATCVRWSSRQTVVRSTAVRLALDRLPVILPGGSASSSAVFRHTARAESVFEVRPRRRVSGPRADDRRRSPAAPPPVAGVVRVAPLVVPVHGSPHEWASPGMTARLTVLR